MKNFKTITTIAAIIIGLALGIGAAKANKPLVAPEGKITIEGKKPVRFDHQVHLDLAISCGECHHDEQHQARTAEAIAALTNNTSLQCAGCHNSAFANPELQKAKDVFHANCKECHKAEYKGKQGPTKCGGCHIKKKKAIEGC